MNMGFLMKLKKNVFIFIILSLILVLVFSILFIRHNISEDNKEKYSKQWGLYNYGQIINGTKGQKGVDINILKAWEITKGSPNVVIGILDTGININNKQICNSVYKSNDMINNLDDDDNDYLNTYSEENNSDDVTESTNNTSTEYYTTITEPSTIMTVNPKSEIFNNKFKYELSDIDKSQISRITNNGSDIVTSNSNITNSESTIDVRNNNKSNIKENYTELLYSNTSDRKRKTYKLKNK